MKRFMQRGSRDKVPKANEWEDDEEVFDFSSHDIESTNPFNYDDQSPGRGKQKGLRGYFSSSKKKPSIKSIGRVMSSPEQASSDPEYNGNAPSSEPVEERDLFKVEGFNSPEVSEYVSNTEENIATGDYETTRLDSSSPSPTGGNGRSIKHTFSKSSSNGYLKVYSIDTVSDERERKTKRSPSFRSTFGRSKSATTFEDGVIPC